MACWFEWFVVLCPIFSSFVRFQGCISVAEFEIHILLGLWALIAFVLFWELRANQGYNAFCLWKKSIANTACVLQVFISLISIGKFSFLVFVLIYSVNCSMMDFCCRSYPCDSLPPVVISSCVTRLCYKPISRWLPLWTRSAPLTLPLRPRHVSG